MRTLFCFLLVCLLLSGCNRENGNEAAPPSSHPEQMKIKQTAESGQKIVRKDQLASYLEALAVADPHVRHATCVIVGNTAVVGIDVDGQLDRARVGTVKYSVAQALRKDPNGRNAIVTADMDLYQRLKEIRQETKRGRPVAGLVEEMADIIGRIVPQLPQDVKPQTSSEEHKKMLEK